MQRREERTEAAPTPSAAPSISTKLTFLSERSFSLKTFRGDADGRVVFYKHSLFRTRLRYPRTRFHLLFFFHPTPSSAVFCFSLPFFFLNPPRLTFPFLSVQRNDPEYLSIYASQFMSAHGLYSNHLLPAPPSAPYLAAYLLLRFILCFWHT